MKIDDLTIGQAKQIISMIGGRHSPADSIPVFDNPVVAQFIGRFVFVCNLQIKGNFCYLTNVRNVRYWDKRNNGLGDLATQGKADGDYIDDWPDQIIPLDKLGPVMPANKDKWS